MKRTLWIVLTAFAVLAATAGLASPVSAAASITSAPSTDLYGYGQGGGRGPGIGVQEPDPILASDILHDYAVTIYSEALGISVEEIEARIAAGETMAGIAVSAGYTLDQFQDLRAQTTTQALAQAVADGVITAEQADWMQYHGAEFSGGNTGSMQGQQSAPRGVGRGNRP